MWDRRTVLKTLITLGVSQTVQELAIWQPSAWQKAYSALAAPNPRKLALLVGVNHYGQSPDLQGCLTDVELQRDLLQYRFGFQAEDILTLTGDAATREGIENAFLEHLLEQAQPGDVVIFHFSGYGGQVKIPDPQSSSDYTLVNGILPSDASLPSKGLLTFNNILLETVQLLGRSLATDKFTCVLDTSYAQPNPIYPINFPIRSSSAISERLNTEELAFQDQLRRRAKDSASKHSNRGTYLFAAQDQQVAPELIGDNLQAGLFTYLLTQYLWQVTSASKLTFTLGQVDQRLAATMGEQQHPQLGKVTKSSLLTYYLLPQVKSGSEGIITQIVDHKTAKIRLSGLPYPVINEYGINSQFSLITNNNPSPELRLRSRSGLNATSEILSPDTKLEVGQRLQEKIRVLPRQMGLSIALDRQLQRIERVDATSALSSIKTVESVHNTGEAYADCLLGKTQTGGYGLFTPGGSLLPKTEGEKNEAIKSAVERLTPHFQRQLALKLYQLTQNEGSSRLGVKVTLEKGDKTPQIVSQRQSQRFFQGQGTNYEGLATQSNLATSASLIPEVDQDQPLQCRIENYSDRPISVFIVASTPSEGTLFGLLEENILSPGESQSISNKIISLSNHLSDMLGIYEIQVISTSVPLNQLSKTFAVSATNPSLRPLKTPLDTARALLNDLHQGCHSDASDNASDNAYYFDVNRWTTLSFIYRVIKPKSL